MNNMASRHTKLPKIISFDAFNTLFIAKKPILKQYVEYSLLNKIQITEDELSNRFPKVFKDLKQKYPNYGKYTKNMDYIEWWSLLIHELYSPLKLNDSFVKGLINWFSSENSYTTYPDVLNYLSNLQKRQAEEVILICSSNGDPRVNSVLESLKLSQYFKKTYLSYDIDVNKPSKQFYDYIIDDLISNYPGLGNFKRDEILLNSWHIGDEIKNDLNGCTESGWNGILIDRTSHLEAIRDLVLKDDEESLTKIKIITDYENTKEISKDEIIRINDKKFVINSFNRLDEILFTQPNITG